MQDKSLRLPPLLKLRRTGKSIARPPDAATIPSASILSIRSYNFPNLGNHSRPFAPFAICLSNHWKIQNYSVPIYSDFISPPPVRPLRVAGLQRTIVPIRCHIPSSLWKTRLRLYPIFGSWQVCCRCAVETRRCSNLLQVSRNKADAAKSATRIRVEMLKTFPHPMGAQP